MANAIEIKNLVVAFNSRKGRLEVLRNLSLTVEQGTVFGFIGPNGAGKTTTMHVLLGFIASDSGSASIFGVDVKHSIARQRIGYLPERAETYAFLTGRELLRMAGRIFRMPKAVLYDRIDVLLKQVNLKEAADRRIATYSRGMLQRIGLAQALINDPDLVILDEPTGGLDPLGRMEVRRVISNLRERGKTVFFSSHELSEVELVCDHIAMMVQGRVVAEGPASELAKPGENLEQYFLDVVRKESGKGSES